MITRRPASYGGVEFDVISWRDTNRRAIDKNRPINKDGAALRNRGLEGRMTDCVIEFFDRPPVAGEQPQSSLDFFERWKLFVVVALSGRVHKFVHPLTGDYLALVEDLDVSCDGNHPDVIFVSCTFVEDSTEPSPFVGTGGRPAGAGLVEVRVQLTAVDTEFASAAPNIDRGFLDEIGSILDTWQDPTAGSSFADDLGRATGLIAEAQELAELTATPSSYAAFVATERLAYQLRKAAESLRSSEPRIRVIDVRVAAPLRKIIIDRLGPVDVQDVYDRVLELNTVRDPGYIPAGTQLRVPFTEDPQTDYLSGVQR